MPGMGVVNLRLGARANARGIAIGFLKIRAYGYSRKDSLLDWIETQWPI